MTLQEIIECKKDMLTPRDIAPVLGCNPYAINIMSKQNPEGLGFPVCRVGNRVKIPRLAFIKFMTGMEGEQ